MDLNRPVYISTVTPVYNGAYFLEGLILELNSFRNKLISEEAPIELLESIFVCDDPIDTSEEILKELQKDYPWVKVISLSRNFGQHPATMAGVLQTNGDWIFTIDEDLQHHPKFFEKLLIEATGKKLDVLYANPESTVHQSLFRDASSKGFKKLMVYLTGNKSIDMFNSYRLLRGSIGRAAAGVTNQETYFDIAIGWFTNRIGYLNLPLKDSRFIETQKSGYSFRKLLSHARRMIQSSDVKILRIGVLLGVLGIVLSFLFTLSVVYIKIFNPDRIQLSGWVSLIVSIFFLGGLNLFFAGLTMESVNFLRMQTHGKPKFFEVDREGDKVVLNYFNSK